MCKILKFFMLTIAAVVISLCLTYEKASAGPAPQLTDLQIVGITSDGNHFNWEYISRNQLIARNTLKGDYAYISIYVEGTVRTGYLRIHSGGVDITPQTTRPINDDKLVGADNIV